MRGCQNLFPTTCTQSQQVSLGGKRSVFELLVMSVPISATLTQTHLLLKEKQFAQDLRVSGKAQVGCFGNLHLYLRRIAKVCTALKKKFAPYTL